MTKAIIPRQKVTHYLLALDHSTGQYKASWLLAHGFRIELWEAVADAIRDQAASQHVADVKATAFGTSYVIDGPLMTPDGRSPLARTVWFVEDLDDAPRFVTIYPLRRRRA